MFEVNLDKRLGTYDTHSHIGDFRCVDRGSSFRFGVEDIYRHLFVPRIECEFGMIFLAAPLGERPSMRTGVWVIVLGLILFRILGCDFGGFTFVAARQRGER